MSRIWLFCCVFVLFSSSALALLPDTNQSTGLYFQDSRPCIAVVRPDGAPGNGLGFLRSLENYYEVVGLAPRCVCRDAQGNPVEGISQYLTLRRVTGTGQSCEGGDVVALADPQPGTYGEYYFGAAPLHAGDLDLGLVRVWYDDGVDEIPIGNQIDMSFVEVISPDLNCDLVVNLGDVTPFLTMYNSGNYHFDIDYAHDGEINLADLQYFSAALGADCP